MTKESWSIENENGASTLSSVIDDSVVITVDPTNKIHDKQACVAIFVVINGLGLIFFPYSYNRISLSDSLTQI